MPRDGETPQSELQPALFLFAHVRTESNMIVPYHNAISQRHVTASAGDGRAKFRRSASVLVGLRLGDTHLSAAISVSEAESATQFLQLPLSCLPDLFSVIVARLPKSFPSRGTTTTAARFHTVAAIDADANDHQRKDLKQRLTTAGFHVLRIVNAPTAALVAYGLEKERGEAHTLVLHLGSRSCTCNVMCTDDGVFEVLNAHRLDDL